MAAITIDQLYVVKDDNTIPDSALAEIMRYIENQHDHLYDDFRYIVTSPISAWKLWKTTRYEPQHKYVGTWPKRVRNYLHKEKHVNLPDSLVAKLGEMIGVQRTNSTVCFEITKFTNWSHGAFEPIEAKPGTCWWETFKATRLGIGQDPNGYAVLFYENESWYEQRSKTSGTGRCWMYVDTKMDVAFVFNSYGPLKLSQMATAIKEAIQGDATFTTKRIELNAYTSHGDRTAFINQGELNNDGRGGGVTGIGYAIGTAADLSNLYSYDLPDLRLKDDYCTLCKQPAPTNRRYKVRSIAVTVCDECSRDASRCRKCGDVYYATDLKAISGETSLVCPMCYEALPVCSTHGKTTYSVKNIWHSDATYCQQCSYEGTAISCQGCGRVYLKESIHTRLLQRLSLSLCIDCINTLRRREYNDKH